VTITGLIAAISGIWAAVVHFAPSHNNAPVDNSSQLQACEHAHGMSHRHQAVTASIAESGFATCDWPPQRFSDPDGFSLISVETLAGPGGSEASDATAIDRITGPCATFLLTYDAKLQGTDVHPVPFAINAGAVTGMDHPGQPFTASEDIAGPDRDQVDFVRNDNAGLADASCQS
jgi:hypothetical protein